MRLTSTRSSRAGAGTVWYSVPWVGYASTVLQPSYRDGAMKLLSGGCVAYGLYLFAGGLLDRRRRVGISTP